MAGSALGDQHVGRARVAVHDGDVALELDQAVTAGPLQQPEKALAEVVVAADEEASLLVGRSSQSAASAVADVAAAGVIARGELIDLAAGELHDGARVIEQAEVADEGEHEGVVEGLAAGDRVQVRALVEGGVAAQDLCAQRRP